MTKITTVPYILFGVLIAVFLITCGKKEQKETAFVVISSDTLSVEELTKLAPDTALPVKKMVLLTSLAKQYTHKKDTAASNVVVKDFRDQLARESGREWTTGSAKNLYRGAQSIRQKLETVSDTRTLETYFNYLLQKSYISSDTGTLAVSLDTSLDFSDTTRAGRKNILASLLCSLFSIDNYLAKVVADFIFSESLLQEDTLSTASLVKGLVYDSAAAAAKKVPRKKARRRNKDNSALALKYRTQESIQRTIIDHIPVIKGIYRKALKKDATMTGIVYVTFRVAASGEVTSATIKTSHITNKEFINPFLDYVKKINFKPIPEEVGPMTFDFPFEFKPEL